MDHERPYAEEIRDIADRSREALGGLRTALSEATGDRRERLSDLSDRATAVVTELASQIAKELANDLAQQYQRRTDEERDQLEEERSLLNSDREAIESDRGSVRAEREALESEREATRRERESLDTEREQLSARREQLDQQQAEVEAQRESTVPEFEALHAEREAIRQLREEAEAERQAINADRESAKAEREAVANERAEWESVRYEVEEDLAGKEQSLIADADLLRQELAELRSGSDGLVTARDDAIEEAAAAAERCEQLSEALDEANRRLTFAAESHAEHQELKEKFDLALSDLQEHRARVAELEQQQADPPEDNSELTAEIERLRGERDDLARQLEEAAQAEPAEAPSTELEDLRTRFEMAVDDIRQLKTENGELREQLSEAKASGGDSSGNDWEAQKQRLLASLESEGEPADPVRQEERASIAGAIEITDAALAEKDREIEGLKQRLENQPDAPAQPASDDEAAAALLDEDAVIRTERERLAKLEQEWEEKLRAAELELSVERAKISRAQSELAEQQVELETLRSAQSGEQGEGRRRWMDKLGLGND